MISFVALELEENNVEFGSSLPYDYQKDYFNYNLIKETSSKWRKITERFQNNQIDNIECTSNIILNTLINIKCNGTKSYQLRR